MPAAPPRKDILLSLMRADATAAVTPRTCAIFSMPLLPL